MRCWRIATAKWALDRSGEGVRLYGGRWNPIGYPVIYTGMTVEIAALEKFDHFPSIASTPLKLVSIDLPDGPDVVYVPDPNELPAEWQVMPASASAQEFGRRWIESREFLAMCVPSAIVAEASNALINVHHAAFKAVDIQIVRDFSFDARMFK
ncbi:MAG: RES family NAD+ phosphorylase [Janthinobacterium lividum]